MLIILLLNQWVAASAMASHAHSQTMPMLGMDMDMTKCNMAMSDNTSSMVMSDTAHDVSEQTNHTKHNMNCCDQDCSCPLSACSSAVLINLDTAKLNINHSFNLISYQFSSLTVSLSQFQKPPQAI